MNTVDAEVMPEPQALAVRGQQDVALPPSPTERVKTAQELRVVEVSEALAPAYAKASTLELTDAEIEQLTAPFPDEMVEIRPHDGLIYIPHIHISDRLNKVFRPGRWALVCRRHWLEGSTMYGEYILLIKGCFVGESVGGHPYVANNPKTNYSDTLESTAAEALRRIAGKRLSCGSQVWNPEYARQWVSKYGLQVAGKWCKRFDAVVTKPAAAPVVTPKPSPSVPKPEPEKPKTATPETRKWMLEQLKATPDGENRQLVAEYFTQAGVLLPDAETLEDLGLQYVPTSKAELAKVLQAIQNFEGGDEAVIVVKHPEAALSHKSPPVVSDESWRNVVVPIPRKGMKRDEYLKNPDTIGSLFDLRHGSDDESQAARNRLWGFCQNYEPKGWTKRDGTLMPPSDADMKFAAALTAFKEWFAANHPDEKL